jgi:hypothetical protein
MSRNIVIRVQDSPELECESIVIIPEIAIAEPGYIKAYTTRDSAHAKHEYHAMAQMAYFQYQDDELECTELENPLKIKAMQEEFDLEQGMVLARTGDGRFLVFVHGLVSRKKLLETGYRYCTRWVRLDI